jgi:hypothetical protein
MLKALLRPSFRLGAKRSQRVSLLINLLRPYHFNNEAYILDLPTVPVERESGWSS